MQNRPILRYLQNSFEFTGCKIAHIYELHLLEASVHTTTKFLAVEKTRVNTDD